MADVVGIPPPEKKGKDAALLAEIRKRYRYATDAWHEIREEAKTDMRYVAGDPWSEDDKKQRRDAGRPCISFDEIGQYINQAINNVRQNKRGIKVNPSGNGASEKTAEFHENLIRGIEYKSNAQRGAYIPAFESAIQRGYGFFKITRDYVSPKSFDQEIKIKGILNPDSVLPDPDCQEADWSDARFYFIARPIPKEEFKRKYPRAKQTDFSEEDRSLAPDWIREDHVVVAEYWRVETKTRTLEIGDKKREIEDKEVKQYITNGIEILERSEEPEPGQYIPIVPILGKEFYVDKGRGPERQLFSMVRLARDPQMAYAFLCSQQTEEAGMSPKVPFVGAKGQFETDQEAWETVNKIPRSYIQYDPVTDATGQQMLPPPSRPQFVPNFQQYELAKDSVRRAIQAAMGINPLPTAAQRANQKSGVALEKIVTQEQVGSFHFTDNFDRALELAGRIIESWIPVVYDTEREIGIHKPDDTRQMVKINTSEPYMDESGAQHHYPTDQGDHDVTISTGPSYQSQREEAAEFADTLIQELRNLPLPPDRAAQLLALAIQLRQLGPLGDQMVDIIKGDPNNQAQQAQAAMMKLQQAGQLIQALQQELVKLQQEKQAKIVDNQFRLEIEKMKIEAQVAMAEVNTKAQILSERAEFINDLYAQLHGQAHDVALQKDQQAHDQQLAEQQHQQALEQGQQQAANASAQSAQDAAQSQAVQQEPAQV